MASKIFVDTDVIIDLLIDRQPHADAASIIFDLADKKKLKLFASSICLNNVHYIVRKELGDKKTRTIIGEILELVEILSVSGKDIENAVNSEFKDFEDAIQHSVALGGKEISAIVTRNTKDYKKSQIPVFNTETYVKMALKEG
ncbi:PIN domain-containing protein [Reichenbachiella carrageenanivorans]|uniref:PIN domain-containing protein n=1 Tax=Reichenbachiella carrageenanivorans TaxID=2979869 RepID=A0ABY6CZX8_9BACT|nr:PIN domain-containing protein [Reichenbachiella carrageenanivorans]UXX79466.1 PIN domain-containing protein [Reichenbachiella carrageenanivorans]